MVPSTRAQKGHWKSEKITIVTSAPMEPRTGAEPTGTRSTCAGSGSGAAGAAGALGASSEPGTGSATIWAYTRLRGWMVRARANTVSMTVENRAKGWAPVTCVPLMKKLGVPWAPTASASALSRSIPGTWVSFSRAARKRAMSRPICCARRSRVARSRFCWFW